MMNKEQAFQAIKQTLDAAIRGGVLINMEQASIVLQAWSVIIKEEKDKNG